MSDSQNRSRVGSRAQASSGQASTHLAYRNWASEALGDERQVYARSTGPGGELVFLPEGAAERFRAAAQAGRLVCPVPGCPSALLTTRGPTERRHHFVHRQAPGDPAHQRSYVRRVAIELLADWIRAAHPQLSVETDVPVDEVTVTILAISPTGGRFALMFIDRRLGVDAWWDADQELEAAGLIRGWVFAPAQYLRYPQPAVGARPDDPAVRDRQRGDVVLDRALFREMRALGHWPLLLNITTRELANLLAPGGRLARRLALRPPAAREGVLHLLPAPLDRCRLARDGIQTPAVTADVLAAPRRAAERQRAMLSRSPLQITSAPPPAKLEHAALPAPAPHASTAPATRLPPMGREIHYRLLAVLTEAGPVTTLATLITALGISDESEENQLREHLYNLRIEGVIDFDRPLGRFSAIHTQRSRDQTIS